MHLLEALILWIIMLCTLLVNCNSFINNTCPEIKIRFNSRKQKKCWRGTQNQNYCINISLIISVHSNSSYLDSSYLGTPLYRVPPSFPQLHINGLNSTTPPHSVLLVSFSCCYFFVFVLLFVLILYLAHRKGL